MRIRALAPWYGGNRMLAPAVGRALEGCSWCGLPFAGGMSEVPCIGARTLLVNDLHRHVINLARVVADETLRLQLFQRLKDLPFHPDVLAAAQMSCRLREDGGLTSKDCALWWATDYFVCIWMGRSSKAGTEGEFNGRTSTRWTSDGGDSVVRYRSALRSLAEWGRTLRRCTFETMDAFAFLERCEDRTGHGIYCDPPFLAAGRKYKFNVGKTAAAEQTWHERLAQALDRFQAATIVVRAYDVPMVADLYPERSWGWQRLVGRKQTNSYAAELLLTRRLRAETPLFAEIHHEDYDA